MARSAVAIFAMLALGAAGAHGEARAQTGPGLPNPDMTAVGVPTVKAVRLGQDQSARMTVPVMIDGRGPFRFVVDTAASGTVISAELAATLKLPPGPAIEVQSCCDTKLVPSAVIASLTVGSHSAADIRAPLLSAQALGADGMLGIDAVRDQTMVLNFRTRELSMRASHRWQTDQGAIVVTGRNRYGQLILVDANVMGIPVFVILDSGAETSIVNSRFRTALEDGLPARAGHAPALVLSVTGSTDDGQFGQLEELTLGDMTLRNLPVVYSDLATFARFHLDHRPAMLLGMDVLRAFSKVEVDYPNRQVSFRLAS